MQARIENEWRDLAYRLFKVTAPPVDIDATLTVPDRGRLLVLLDEMDGFPCTPMHDIELWAPFHMTLPPATHVEVALYNAQGQIVDLEEVVISQFQGTVNASTGTTARPDTLFSPALI